MKKLLALTLLVYSFGASADDTFNTHSYGSQTLYYSQEGMKERRQLELLKEANEIAREQLDIERERFSIEKSQHERPYSDSGEYELQSNE